LILAIATFGATRSANRSARIAEKSLLVGLRPTLVPSRPEDRNERVDFAAGGDTRSFELPGGRAIIEHDDGVSFLAISLRNVGTGAAQIQGWYVRRGFTDAATPHADPDDFRVQ